MADPVSPIGPAWSLPADRVWLRQDPGTGRNCLVVAGTAGLLVVDPPLADDPRDLVEAVAALVAGDVGAGEVVAVVVTHAHTTADLPTTKPWPGVLRYVHEDAAGGGARTDRTLSSVAVVDLGDRAVELVHPGRAHTSGDLVVRVPDADLLAVGGLVSGDGVPAYGPESFPLAWPAALDLVIGLSTPQTVVVPARGPVLTRADLEDQRNGVGVVAETLSDLASRGVAAGDALGAAAWPFPAERLRDAVLRGYDQLPRTARRLPLL